MVHLIFYNRTYDPCSLNAVILAFYTYAGSNYCGTGFYTSGRSELGESPSVHILLL